MVVPGVAEGPNAVRQLVSDVQQASRSSIQAVDLLIARLENEISRVQQMGTGPTAVAALPPQPVPSLRDQLAEERRLRQLAAQEAEDLRIR